MAGNTSTPGTSVTSRVLAILDAFDEAHHQLTLTEISCRSGLSLTTTHRIVRDLEEGGALRRRGDGLYVVGRRMWDLGLLAPVERGLREIASPFMHDIYASMLTSVHLCVREETTALCLDRLWGHASGPVLSRMGGRFPLHATAVGKVLLAHAPTYVQDEVMASLTPQTRHTITDEDVLRTDLVAVIDNGFARTDQEMALDACSLAVPVRRQGSVIAALGVVVPDLAHGESELLAALVAASQGITRSL